jgi:hypothetical protein
VLVAHTYNPSYSEGRNQEDHSSKPAPGQIIQVEKTYLKKHTANKRASVGPEFKSQYHKKKKKSGI